MPVTLSPYALTSLEAVREHLGVPPTTLTFDNLLTRFINVATAKIESFCDRKFLRRPTTEYQDGFANDRILLDQWPASKPSEVWIDGSSEFTDVANRLDPSQYELDLSARGEGIGLSLKGRYFGKGTRNIKVVYLAGFDPIPADLEDACIWMVEFLYDMRGDRRVGVETKGKNQENTTFLQNLPEIVLDTLNGYKRFEWPTGDRPVSTR